MSTFDGVLREFPFISVDRFNTGSSVFLLTHFHEDHLVGLANKSFKGVVYCSNGTKALMECSPKYRSVAKNFCALPYNSASRIELSNSQKSPVYITLIEAYHCPGACMFLVEQAKCSDSEPQSSENTFSVTDSTRFDAEKAVLITGDVRAEKWWREGLRTVPALQSYISGECSLDNIYFDSTFSYRQEPYIEMPPNNMGIHASICLLKKYPLRDPEIHYEFTDTVLGFEQVWAFFAGYFKASLQISSPELRSKLQVAAKHDRLNGAILSKALSAGSRKSVFHIGKAEHNKSIVVSVKQCIDFNVMDYAGICCPIPFASISHNEDLRLVYTTKSGNSQYQLRDRMWLLPKGGQELLPLQIKLVFSRHSSFTETKELLCMFAAKQVFPCVSSQSSWKNGFVMARLFPDFCSSIDNYFDQMMMAQHGLPTKEVMSRPVVTIDRWDIDECKKEQEFVQSVLDGPSKLKLEDKPGPSLINLRKVVRIPKFATNRSTGSDSFLAARKKDFSVQRLVGGKRSKSFEKFVAQQQDLYKDRYRNHLDPSRHSSGLSSTLGGSSDVESNSRDSSLDLLEMMVNDKKGKWVTSGPSEVSSTQQMARPIARHLRNSITRPIKRRSFVSSSFNSFEESQVAYRDRGSLSQNIYYHSEASLNARKIDKISKDLELRPLCWFDLRETLRQPSV